MKTVDAREAQDANDIHEEPRLKELVAPTPCREIPAKLKSKSNKTVTKISKTKRKTNIIDA
jgi:hypothetical protein